MHDTIYTPVYFTSAGDSSSPNHIVLTACPGEQLALNCTTNDSSVKLLQWSINTTSFQQERSISVRGELPIVQIVANETVFSFTRISELSVYPFITKMVISPVYGDMNGTEVSCTAVSASEAIITAVIHVIRGKTLNNDCTQSLSHIL